MASWVFFASVPFDVSVMCILAVECILNRRSTKWLKFYSNESSNSKATLRSVDDDDQVCMHIYVCLFDVMNHPDNASQLDVMVMCLMAISEAKTHSLRKLQLHKMFCLRNELFSAYRFVCKWKVNKPNQTSKQTSETNDFRQKQNPAHCHQFTC